MFGFQKTDVMGRICGVKETLVILEFDYQNGQKGHYNVVRPKSPILALGDWVFASGELVGDTLSPLFISVLSSEKAPIVESIELAETVVVKPHILIEPPTINEKESIVLPVVSEVLPVNKPGIFKKPLFNMAIKPPVPSISVAPASAPTPATVKVETGIPKPILNAEVVPDVPPSSNGVARSNFQKPKIMLGRGVSTTPFAPTNATVSTGYRKIAEVNEVNDDDEREYDVEEPESEEATQTKAPSTPRTTPDSVDKDIPW